MTEISGPGPYSSPIHIPEPSGPAVNTFGRQVQLVAQTSPGEAPDQTPSGDWTPAQQTAVTRVLSGTYYVENGVLTEAGRIAVGDRRQALQQQFSASIVTPELAAQAVLVWDFVNDRVTLTPEIATEINAYQSSVKSLQANGVSENNLHTEFASRLIQSTEDSLQQNLTLLLQLLGTDETQFGFSQLDVADSRMSVFQLYNQAANAEARLEGMIQYASSKLPIIEAVLHVAEFLGRDYVNSGQLDKWREDLQGSQKTFTELIYEAALDGQTLHSISVDTIVQNASANIPVVEPVSLTEPQTILPGEKYAILNQEHLIKTLIEAFGMTYGTPMIHVEIQNQNHKTIGGFRVAWGGNGIGGTNYYKLDSLQALPAESQLFDGGPENADYYGFLPTHIPLKDGTQPALMELLRQLNASGQPQVARLLVSSGDALPTSLPVAAKSRELSVLLPVEPFKTIGEAADFIAEHKEGITPAMLRTPAFRQHFMPLIESHLGSDPNTAAVDQFILKLYWLPRALPGTPTPLQLNKWQRGLAVHGLELDEVLFDMVVPGKVLIFDQVLERIGKLPAVQPLRIDQPTALLENEQYEILNNGNLLEALLGSFNEDKNAAYYVKLLDQNGNTVSDFKVTPDNVINTTEDIANITALELEDGLKFSLGDILKHRDQGELWVPRILISKNGEAFYQLPSNYDDWGFDHGWLPGKAEGQEGPRERPEPGVFNNVNDIARFLSATLTTDPFPPALMRAPWFAGRVADMVNNLIGSTADPVETRQVRDALVLKLDALQHQWELIEPHYRTLMHMLASVTGISAEAPVLETAAQQNSAADRPDFSGQIFDEASELQAALDVHNSLIGANFVEADLAGLDLSERTVDQANFSRAFLNNVNWTDASAVDAVFHSAGLAGADFIRTDLTAADFTGAVMYSAAIKEANLTNATLLLADLHFAKMTDANLQGADLRGVDLGESILKNVSFKGANLAGADLSRAVLENVDFTDANLSGTDFSNLRVGTIRINQAALNTHPGLETIIREQGGIIVEEQAEVNQDQGEVASGSPEVGTDANQTTDSLTSPASDQTTQSNDNPIVKQFGTNNEDSTVSTQLPGGSSGPDNQPGYTRFNINGFEQDENQHGGFSAKPTVTLPQNPVESFQQNNRPQTDNAYKALPTAIRSVLTAERYAQLDLSADDIQTRFNRFQNLHPKIRAGIEFNDFAGWDDQIIRQLERNSAHETRHDVEINYHQQQTLTAQQLADSQNQLAQAQRQQAEAIAAAQISKPQPPGFVAEPIQSAAPPAHWVGDQTQIFPANAQNNIVSTNLRKTGDSIPQHTIKSAVPMVTLSGKTGSLVKQYQNQTNSIPRYLYMNTAGQLQLHAVVEKGTQLDAVAIPVHIHKAPINASATAYTNQGWTGVPQLSELQKTAVDAHIRIQQTNIAPVMPVPAPAVPAPSLSAPAKVPVLP